MNQGNFIDSLFSPLSSQYCNYFYYLMIFFFGVFVLSAAFVLKSLFGKKKLKANEMLALLTQPLLLYFINRLYYSMCIGSLN